MNNWAERVRQLQEKREAEEHAAQQAYLTASLNEDNARMGTLARRSELLAYVLNDVLRVEGKLAEIRNQIWKGVGELESDEFSFCRTRLAYSYPTAEEITRSEVSAQ